MSELEPLSQAEKALAVAETPAEVEAVWNAAEAYRNWTKKAKEQNRAASIKLRAGAKGGAMIERDERVRAGRPRTENRASLALFFPDAETDEVRRHLSKLWQFLSRLEQNGTLPAYLASKPDEITFAGLDRFAKEQQVVARRERVATIAQRQAAMPDATYAVIYADPPWTHEFVFNPRKHVPYPTMSVAEICALEVPAGPDCVLFLWATSPHLREALDVMDAWGFTYRTNAVWVKNRIGLGYWLRGQHELLLIGGRGDISPPAEANRPPSVLAADVTEHSAKPDAAYELIERMTPDLPRIELFARRARPGWAAWGNEAPQ